MQEQLIYGGRVFTADPERPSAEALVARRGSIVYAGSLRGARAIASDSAVRIDSAGGLILPGFVDGHAHVEWTGASATKGSAAVGTQRCGDPAASEAACG